LTVATQQHSSRTAEAVGGTPERSCSATEGSPGSEPRQGPARDRLLLCARPAPPVRPGTPGRTPEGVKRIFLSPPHLGGDELEYVKDALASNWVAPLGPHVDAFEREVAELIGLPHAAALASGTAALHLALRVLGVGPGDEVLCSTLTFAASATPALYEGGRPVFLDVEPGSWDLDPELLRQELRACAGRGRLPKAVVVVDLCGQAADYEPILEACAAYGVPVVEDAAHSLGATYRGRMAGSLGRLGVLSFNGNKIITASTGGMLLSAERELIDRAYFLATQARDPAPHYEHSVLGYNYRLSNILAAIGRAQLRLLPERLAARRRNHEFYRAALAGLPGLDFMPQAGNGRPNHWLTCVTIDPKAFGASCDDVRLALEAEEIESRLMWKPLHRQPVFAGCRYRGGAVAERVFERGLCLPSGSGLTEEELGRVAAVVKGRWRGGGG
jgi:pyridoxal phosphate-dependent aminotransferase EpsN